MFEVYNKSSGQKESGCWAIRQGQLMRYSKTMHSFLPVNNNDYAIKKRRKG